jgi:hypothetical protein
MNIYTNKIIGRLVEIQATGMVSEDQAIAILVFLRQHLEQEGLKNYGITKFYCDWVLHVSLERGLVRNILDDIFKALDVERRYTNDRVCEILKMKNLRSEINEILRNEGIVTKVFDSKTIWTLFVRKLLGVVLEKPLKRNDLKPSASSHVSELVLFAPHLEPPEQDYVRQYNLKGGEVFWRIKRLPEDEIYEGPLMLTEFPTDFGHP